MRDYVVALNHKTQDIFVTSSKEFKEMVADEIGTYDILDDSDSEYKASVKAKYIKSMGVNRYIERLKSVYLGA